MDVARAFARKKRSASAHFCIGRDGSKVQCVSLADAAWHAGDGRMHPEAVGPVEELDPTPRVVNLRSIGIEISNVGWAVDQFDVPAIERMLAKHQFHRRTMEWERYDQRAIDTLRYIVAMIQMTYPIKYVLGHSDVTNSHTLGKVGGKTDPGPHFPWELIDWEGLGIQRVRYDKEKRAWV